MMMSSGAECRTFRSAACTERCGDRELALAREGLRLQLVFVDGADDQRRAVALGDRADALEFLFAVLQVDRS